MSVANDYSKFVDIGTVFEKRRIEIGFDLENVAKSLKISKEIIIKIESGEVIDILDKVYYEGIVIKYANLIGLKSDKILEYISSDIKLFGQTNEQRIIYLRYQGRTKKDTLSMKLVFIVVAICLAVIIINTFFKKNQIGIKVSEYLESGENF